MNGIFTWLQDLIGPILLLIGFLLPFCLPVLAPLIFTVKFSVRLKNTPEENGEEIKVYRKCFRTSLIFTIALAIISLFLFAVLLFNLDNKMY